MKCKPRMTTKKVLAKNKRSYLVERWTVFAVILSQTVTAGHLSDRTEPTTAAVADVTASEVRGSCWLRTVSAGRCKGLYALNLTRAECCALQPGSRYVSHATGWSPLVSMTPRQYFYWIIVGHGVPGCHHCRYSCNGFRCGGPGSNKVCRMRHGQPRCVCAADCSVLLHGVGGGGSSASGEGNSTQQQQQRSATAAAVTADIAASWHGPVCAFDGRTHRSLCALAKSNCRSGRDFHVEYIGPCQTTCENVTCPGGRHCAQDQHGVPHCVRCRSRCGRSSLSSPSRHVCGGDGHTYSSFCALERHTCLSGRTIRLAYRGNCRPGLTCRQLRCAVGERCLMNTASQTPVCFPCDRPCVLDAGGTAVGGRRAVCGSDGRTYESYCELERAACRRGVVVDTVRAGRCTPATGETTTDIAQPGTT